MKLKKIVYILLGAIVLVFIIVSFADSLFLTASERLQIIVYGQDSRIYSIDTRGNTNYIIHFAPDEKLGVPGGYGYYRVGALGKLVSLDKNPQILGKAFSVASSSFVSYYFYPPKGDLYYGRQVSREAAMPTATELFRYSSNANVFDRIYLFFHFLRVKKSDYLLLRSRGDSQDKNGARIFVPGNFSKETEGYLFNPAYRRERQTVQIVYTENYNAARDIGSILEGSGVRVVDIKKINESDSKCVVTAAEGTDTSAAVSHFFACPVRAGKSQVSDILFDIRGIESEWEIE